jgi:hypothetical protein
VVSSRFADGTPARCWRSVKKKIPMFFFLASIIAFSSFVKTDSSFFFLTVVFVNINQAP